MKTLSKDEENIIQKGITVFIRRNRGLYKIKYEKEIESELYKMINDLLGRLRT